MAILQFTYCAGSGSSGGQKRVYYDDVQHKVTNGESTGVFCFSSPPENLYVHEDGGYTYTVYPQSFFPFAYVEKTVYVPPVSCNVAITDIEVSDTSDGFSNGTLDITATSSHLPVRYKLDNGGYQDSNVFVRVSKGDHVVTVRDAQGCEVSQQVNVGPNSDLSIDDIIVVNKTPAALGSITVIASGSFEPIRYQLRTGIFGYQFSNVFEDLEPGSYTLNVKDEAGVVLTRTVYVGQDLVAPADPYVVYPIANAIRMVKAGAPGFDGLLHRQEIHAGFYQQPYFQPVQKSDPTRLQIHSNYETNTLEILNEAGAVVDAVPALKMTDNIDNGVTLNAILEEDWEVESHYTDCRFPDDKVPLFVEVGMLVQIGGTTNMDGVFEVIEVNRMWARHYFRIKRAYEGAGPATSCTVTFNYSEQPYDVYEFPIDWTGIPAGKYNLKLTGTLGASTYEFVSEPIDLRDTQKNTVLITYKNIDNAYDVDYSSGIEHVLRVRATFFERTNPGQRKVHRDSKNRSIKISAFKQRAVKLEVWNAPPWLHEKLDIVFDHDYFTVNGVEYQTEEDYDLTYYEDYSLPSGEIRLTQVQDFYAQNSDDDGDVDGTLLQVNEGYLKI